MKFLYRQILLLLIITLAVTINGCDEKAEKQNKEPNRTAPSKEAREIPLSTLQQNIPELTSYLQELKICLESNLPIMLLSPRELNQQQMNAQSIAIQHPDFLRDCWELKTNAPLHSEIMQITTLKTGLVKVEMYNFFYNSTTVATVDVNRYNVVKVDHLNAVQPIANKRLKDLAVKVALKYPEVYENLNLTKGAVVADVTVSVNETRCERSRHMSVAPTFKKDNISLWAIVDINEWQLIGVKAVDEVTNAKPIKITERTVQNEHIMETYCNKTKTLTEGDWELKYTLTKSDGMEIKDVKFKDTPVIKSAKLVDWHVNYSIGNGYGFTDAMGCPMYSSAAVVAFKDAEIEPITKDGRAIGFSLIQDFRSPVWPVSCNYRYQNKFEFYNDGSFRVCGVNLGIGCGVGAKYKPVFRIDLSPGGNNSEKVAIWKGEGWEELADENWHLQANDTKYHANGSLFKLTKNNGSGYYIVPSQNLQDPDSRGDNAYSYFSKVHVDIEEGQANMETIGPADSDDYHQGPEKFIEPAESLNNNDLVFWYVPQMDNDDSPDNKFCWVDISIKNGKEHTTIWPGVVGPLFVPFQPEVVKQ